MQVLCTHRSVGPGDMLMFRSVEASMSFVHTEKIVCEDENKGPGIFMIMGVVCKWEWQLCMRRRWRSEPDTHESMHDDNSRSARPRLYVATTGAVCSGQALVHSIACGEHLIEKRIDV